MDRDHRGEGEVNAEKVRATFAKENEVFCEHVLIHPGHPDSSDEAKVISNLRLNHPGMHIRLDYDHLVTNDGEVLNSEQYTTGIANLSKSDIKRGARYAAVYLRPIA